MRRAPVGYLCGGAKLKRGYKKTSGRISILAVAMVILRSEGHL